MPAMSNVERIKAWYLPGTRIYLIHMNDEDYGVPDGTYGTVDFVDDIGTVHMKWDNGSSLGLIPGLDYYQILERPANA